MDNTSQERCQRVSDLSHDDRGFPRLSTMEFLTQVGLMKARVAVELVDAPLEAGRALWPVVSVSFYDHFLS